MAAGWVAIPSWGGNLVVPNWCSLPNGNLGLKFVPEMIPGCGPALSLQMAAKQGDMGGDLAPLRVRAGQALAYRRWTKCHTKAGYA